MAHEYEKRIIGMLGGVEDRHFIDLSDHKQELREAYAKARAFDEILNVDYIVAPDDYAHEVTKIIDKYMEDK